MADGFLIAQIEGEATLKSLCVSFDVPWMGFWSERLATLNVVR